MVRNSRSDPICMLPSHIRFFHTETENEMNVYHIFSHSAFDYSICCIDGVCGFSPSRFDATHFRSIQIDVMRTLTNFSFYSFSSKNSLWLSELVT